MGLPWVPAEREETADVVRVVEGVSGRVPMQMALRPRFDYGRIVPCVRHSDGAGIDRAVPGTEGAFVTCTFWLATTESNAMTARR